MEERLLPPSKEKHSYGSLDEEEDEIDGIEDDENVTVILRRGKNVPKSRQESSSSWIPSSSRPGSSSSKIIHSNKSQSSSSLTKSSLNNKSNRNPDEKSIEEDQSQRSHPTMGLSSSSCQSSDAGGTNSHSNPKSSNSSEGEQVKPGPIRRLTSSTSVTWIMRNLRKILVKYWIWIVALMLMIMSVGGTRVVIYRVFYMFLFLTFILTFQVSTKKVALGR